MGDVNYGVVPQKEPFVPVPEILCHPNIPKPLHGIAPRVIAGRRWWDEERQKAYAETGFRCSACGTHKQEVKGNLKRLEAHEFYLYDYIRGRLTYLKSVALCPYCHNFIHSGKLEVLHNEEKISDEVYTAIFDHGHAVLKAAGLREKWEARHDHDCAVKWQDWRMIFEGREYGPSSRSMDDWLDGAWRDWKPPQTTKGWAK